MRQQRDPCVRCRSLVRRRPFGAQRCILGRVIILNDDPATCPAYFPIDESVRPPGQLLLFAKPHGLDALTEAES